MKVVLTDKVKSLGNIGEIVNVSEVSMMGFLENIRKRAISGFVFFLRIVLERA